MGGLISKCFPVVFLKCSCHCGLVRFNFSHCIIIKYKQHTALTHSVRQGELFSFVSLMLKREIRGKCRRKRKGNKTSRHHLAWFQSKLRNYDVLHNVYMCTRKRESVHSTGNGEFVYCNLRNKSSLRPRSHTHKRSHKWKQIFHLFKKETCTQRQNKWNNVEADVLYTC